MGHGSNPRKQPPRKEPATGYLGVSKKQDGFGYMLVYEERLRSAAWQALTHSARLVLLDMDWRYYSGPISGYDKRDISETGFCFTLGDCQFSGVSHATFERAMKQILAHGFYERRPDLKSLKLFSANVYAPSRNWKDWKPDDDIAAKLQGKIDIRSRRLDRDKTRKTKAARGDRNG